jgi:hypothetical protein
VPDSQFETSPNVVIYKENGDKKYIVFDGVDGMKLSRSLNRDTLVKAPAIIGTLTRAYSMMRTSLVPTFIIRNLRADLLQLSLNMTAEKKADLIKDVYKNLLPSWKSVWTYERDGKASGSLGKYANEFFENGGQIAGLGVQAVDKIHSGLYKRSKHHGVAGNVVRKAMHAYEYVERSNASVETGTRLALYVAMRKAGYSISDSVEAGKNITVNFNRKGELSPAINALYMFSNVAIQDAFRTGKALSSKRGMALAGSVMIAGFLASLLNNGDDDDEYKNIPEQEKQRNILIKLNGKYVKQPIRGIWAWLYYTGTKAGDVYAGGYDPAKAGLEVGAGAVDLLNFLGSSGSVYQFLSPTITDPIVQMAEGKNWYGGPMFQRKFKDSQPDSDTALSATPSWMKGAAQGLNRMTGGDDVTKGYIDMAPETIKHVIDTLMGGVGTDIANTAGAAQDIAQGNFRPERTPFVRDFVRSTPDSTARYYESLSKYEDAKYRYDNYDKASDKRRLIYETPYMRPSSAERLKDISDEVKELRKKEKEAKSDAMKNAYRMKRVRLQDRLIGIIER